MMREKEVARFLMSKYRQYKSFVQSHNMIPKNMVEELLQVIDFAREEGMFDELIVAENHDVETMTTLEEIEQELGE